MATGRYALTDDRNEAAALPHRSACLIDADTKPQNEFAGCWHRGSWEGAMRRILRRFRV
jgi:hypothetical protein